MKKYKKKDHGGKYFEKIPDQKENDDAEKLKKWKKVDDSDNQGNAREENKESEKIKK